MNDLIQARGLKILQPKAVSFVSGSETLPLYEGLDYRLPRKERLSNVERWKEHARIQCVHWFGDGHVAYALQRY